MIKLSDRLQRIAERIEHSKTMADIGTDHGFLPVYLLQHQICERAIAADVSEPSLDKAVQCGQTEIPELYESGAFQTRAGDGLAVLKSGEVEAVVIAGMGGQLIRDIMEADLQHTCSFQRFILQPRSGQGFLRKWLVENGFRIIGEDVVTEGKFLPEIITVLSPDSASDGSSDGGSDGGADCSAGETRRESDVTILPDLADQVSDLTLKEMLAADGEDIRWEIPPWMIRAQGVVEDFLERCLQREQRVLQQIRKAKECDPQQEQRILNNITYLETMQEEYRNGTK